MARRKEKAIKGKDKEKRVGRTKRKREKRAFMEGKTIRPDGLLGSAMSAIPEINLSILFMVLLLCFIGLMTVYSAGYYQTVASGNTTYFLMRQAFFMITGFVLLVFATCFDYHKYNKYGLFAIIVSLLLLVAVLLVGDTANGAQRWIGFGPIRITPSEISKLAVIIYTSVFLAADPRRIKGKFCIYLFAIMGAHFVLIVKQPNLSTAIVVSAIMVGIMFAAGLNRNWILAMLGGGAAGTFVILTFMKNTHWYDRLTNWRDPFADAQGSGYQVSQSLIALGNGGLKGMGIGKSITKNLYLPEPQNDFILAVFGEETGFIGFLALMCLYIILLYLCIMTAAKAKDRLGFYLAAGVGIMLGLQVIINVAVVTASMPATGITLPFISYGGTSIWVFMYAMGIVLNVSRGQKRNKKEVIE